LIRRHIRGRSLEDPAATVARKQRELTEWLADRDVSCPNCKYNLRGLRELSCPECGYGLDPEVLIPHQTDCFPWKPWWFGRSGAGSVVIAVHLAWMCSHFFMTEPMLWFGERTPVSIVGLGLIALSVIVFAVAKHVVEEENRYRPSDGGPSRRWARICWLVATINAAGLITALILGATA